MAVTVANLQDRIAAHFGAVVGDENLSAVDLLDDINQVYRFDIPDSIGSGRFRERLNAVLVPAGTSTRIDINTPGVVTSDPTGLYGAILGTWAGYVYLGETHTTYLNFFTSERDFYEENDPAIATQARPTDILVEGTVFTLRPIPNANTYVILDALKYRPALLQAGSLTLDYEAKVIEYVGAAYAAIRLGDDDTAKRLMGLAEPVFDKLRSLEWRSASSPILVGRNF